MMNNEEYMKLGSAKLDHAVSVVNSLIDTLPEPRKFAVRKMMDGPVGEAFFTAPASTKRIYHYAFPGGLALHSLNVVNYAIRIAGAIAPNRWPNHKVAFCALFHDLGKAGDGKDPYYVPTSAAWKMDRGENYELNSAPGYTFLPSSELGLYVLAKHGVDLDRDEYLAIRLNDGPAAEGNSDYAFREPDLAVLINMADNWAMRQEKAEDRR